MNPAAARDRAAAACGAAMADAHNVAGVQTMARVEYLKNVSGPGGSFGPGDVGDVTEAQAEQLRAARAARRLDALTLPVEVASKLSQEAKELLAKAGALTAQQLADLDVRKTAKKNRWPARVVKEVAAAIVLTAKIIAEEAIDDSDDDGGDGAD